MKSKYQSFIVQVLDTDRKAVTDAHVTLVSDRDEFRLFCESSKGYYSSEKIVPKGEYTVRVIKKPFEEESRKLFVGEGAH